MYAGMRIFNIPISHRGLELEKHSGASAYILMGTKGAIQHEQAWWLSFSKSASVTHHRSAGQINRVRNVFVCSGYNHFLCLIKSTRAADTLKLSLGAGAEEQTGEAWKDLAAVVRFIHSSFSRPSPPHPFLPPLSLFPLFSRCSASLFLSLRAAF